MNKEYRNLIFIIIGLFIYSVLHVLGTYGYKYWEKQGKDISFIFFVGIFFGFLSYVVKVPLFYYYGTQTSVLIYITYLVILSIVVVLFSKYILNEQEALHTYITLIIVVILVAYNQYLTFREKK
jgi:hypothetical protein